MPSDIHKQVNKQFKLIKRLVVIYYLTVAIVAIIIATGNYNYTTKGILHELKVDHPNVTEILKDSRNIISLSPG